MDALSCLKEEMSLYPKGVPNASGYLKYLGYSEHYDACVPKARAYAIEALLTKHRKHVYLNDLIAGSICGKLADGYSLTADMLKKAESVNISYGANHFGTNADHFTPDYRSFLADGVGGTLDNIRASMQRHSGDKEKQNFLEAAEISISALGKMIEQYAEAAEQKAQEALVDSQRRQLSDVAQTCFAICQDKPRTFRQALQLVWLVHIAFQYEDRYAMALGRLDQYLYPFYDHDLQNGDLTREQAVDLVSCTLYKIGEAVFFGGDDVVNIAIGGLRPDGEDGVNALSYVILEAVDACRIPGPNLSARIHSQTPDCFLDACLEVIGTGIGYPALMNDEVNIPALQRLGYALEDCRDYSMVGCIENFITGKQPPWSDGRYNVPKYIELALNRGTCLLTGMKLGPETIGPEAMDSMDDFLAVLKTQMEFGFQEYMMFFHNENDRYNKVAYTQPLLSCFCQSCIERGLDINNGGAFYPSVHGAGCMGIATFADSLAAIQEVVYTQRYVTMAELRDALATNFVGYDELRHRLLRAPKYGNNDDQVDRYAILFVDWTHEITSRHRTRDGGRIYTAIASNVNNIPAGLEVAATPDGRFAREPVSDAASPMHGCDKNGSTAALNSIAKPDYTLVATGTVLNQKYSPSMFISPEKRAKLQALIRVYFQKGGQEIQINAISKDMLYDAMEHPENYRSLVVRVSGFSAYYTRLDKSVQQDILKRTEHE